MHECAAALEVLVIDRLPRTAREAPFRRGSEPEIHDVGPIERLEGIVAERRDMCVCQEHDSVMEIGASDKLWKLLKHVAPVVVVAPDRDEAVGGVDAQRERQSHNHRAPGHRTPPGYATSDRN